MPDDVIFRKAAFGGFNKDDVLNYIEKIKVENAVTKNMLNEKSNEVDQLKKTIEDLNLRLSEFNIECDNKIEILRKEYEAKFEEIKAEAEKAAELSNKASLSAEESIGAAMLDVRRYADLLLGETCSKIDEMSDKADAATAKTLSRVLDISSGIQAFSDKLNSVLKDILSENDIICKELSGFKGTLRLPFEEASQDMNQNIFGD